MVHSAATLSWVSSGELSACLSHMDTWSHILGPSMMSGRNTVRAIMVFCSGGLCAQQIPKVDACCPRQLQQQSLTHMQICQFCLAAGAYAANLIDETQRFDINRNACPGAGACGGMYTANTMASAIEAMGMSLPYSSSNPAEDPLKKLECRMAGRQVDSATVTAATCNGV